MSAAVAEEPKAKTSNAPSVTKYVILGQTVGRFTRGQVVDEDEFRDRPGAPLPNFHRLTQKQAVRLAFDHERHLKSVDLTDTSAPGESLVDQVNKLNEVNAILVSENTELRAEIERVKASKSAMYDPDKDAKIVKVINEKDELYKQASKEAVDWKQKYEALLAQVNKQPPRK